MSHLGRCYNMEVLKQIIKEKLYCFHDNFNSWEEAIIKNAQPLIDNNYVDERYPKAIIDCIKEYGPYIILVPNVAMPHSTESAEGVFKTGVSFMKVNKPVKFDENDEEKNAQLFFMVASENGEQHIRNIQNLCEIFENQELLNGLSKVNNEADLIKLVKQYCK